MPSPAPKRRDIAGLAAVALVILAFVPLTLHALRRASAHEAPRLSLDGVDSVADRAVLLHRDADQDDTAADRGAGSALACGVLRRS